MRLRWRKFQGLSLPEQLLLLRVTLVLPWIALALRLRGLRWTQARLSQFIPPLPIQDGLSPDVVNRVVQGAAAIFSSRGACLRCSLVVWWLLR